jgi:hypothetical protein
MKSGEKRVLLFSIPAALIVAVTIQITMKGIPKFYDSILNKIQEEAWKSRNIIAAYAIKEAKSNEFRKEKNFETDESYQIGSTFGSGEYKASEDAIVKGAENYRKAQKDTWDATYQEIERRELKEDIKNYQDLFEKEKKQ